ncbi:hypothetical protein BDZ97DRAFT_1923794 [Flammula alnicola]|nr:hypothetical protein BDZ97DRAFT_1923794 [Flammula alnicola]
MPSPSPRHPSHFAPYNVDPLGLDPWYTPSHREKKEGLFISTGLTRNDDYRPSTLLTSPTSATTSTVPTWPISDQETASLAMPQAETTFPLSHATTLANSDQPLASSRLPSEESPHHPSQRAEHSHYPSTGFSPSYLPTTTQMGLGADQDIYFWQMQRAELKTGNFLDNGPQYLNIPYNHLGQPSSLAHLTHSTTQPIDLPRALRMPHDHDTRMRPPTRPLYPHSTATASDVTFILPSSSASSIPLLEQPSHFEGHGDLSFEQFLPDVQLLWSSSQNPQPIVSPSQLPDQGFADMRMPLSSDFASLDSGFSNYAAPGDPMRPGRRLGTPVITVHPSNTKRDPCAVIRAPTRRDYHEGTSVLFTETSSRILVEDSARPEPISMSAVPRPPIGSLPPRQELPNVGVASSATDIGIHRTSKATKLCLLNFITLRRKTLDLSDLESVQQAFKQYLIQSAPDGNAADIEQLFGNVKHDVGTTAGRQERDKKKIHETLYYCCFPHCPSNFTRRHGLENHLAAHLGVTPRRCAFCKKCLSTMKDLPKDTRIYTLAIYTLQIAHVSKPEVFYVLIDIR